MINHVTEADILRAAANSKTSTQLSVLLGHLADNCSALSRTCHHLDQAEVRNALALVRMANLAVEALVAAATEAKRPSG